MTISWSSLELQAVLSGKSATSTHQNGTTFKVDLFEKITVRRIGAGGLISKDEVRLFGDINSNWNEDTNTLTIKPTKTSSFPEKILIKFKLIPNSHKENVISEVTLSKDCRCEGRKCKDPQCKVRPQVYTLTWSYPGKLLDDCVKISPELFQELIDLGPGQNGVDPMWNLSKKNQKTHGAIYKKVKNDEVAMRSSRHHLAARHVPFLNEISVNNDNVGVRNMELLYPLGPLTVPKIEYCTVELVLNNFVNYETLFQIYDDHTSPSRMFELPRDAETAVTQNYNKVYFRKPTRQHVWNDDELKDWMRRVNQDIIDNPQNYGIT